MESSGLEPMLKVALCRVQRLHPRPAAARQRRRVPPSAVPTAHGRGLHSRCPPGGRRLVVVGPTLSRAACAGVGGDEAQASTTAPSHSMDVATTRCPAAPLVGPPLIRTEYLADDNSSSISCPELEGVAGPCRHPASAAPIGIVRRKAYSAGQATMGRHRPVQTAMGKPLSATR